MSIRTGLSVGRFRRPTKISAAYLPKHLGHGERSRGGAAITYASEARRKTVASEDGYSRKQWQAFAALGLLAAPFSEEVGGLGGGPLSTMIIMQEFGRHLVVEPFVETVVLAGGLLERVGSAEQKQGFIPDIIAGTRTWALAWTEKSSRFDLANVTTMARGEGESYVLTGEKTAVIAAPWADYLIVSARTSGDSGGVSLFVVDRRAANLDLQSFKTIDGRRAAEISLRGVAGQLLGEEGEGVAALEACRDLAIGALCAEAVGAMAELNSATLGYSKTRKQFGTTIGSFQVLQHRMVDMFIAHQEALSLMQHLTLSLDAGEPAVSRLASGAKSKIGYAGKFIADQTVQLHGGMGMTDELNVGHYFKRISSINIQFGDPAFHVLRYAQFNAAA